MWSAPASWEPINEWVEWIEYAAGFALTAAGLIAIRRRSGRSIGRLMLLAGIAYFIPYVGNVPTDVASTISTLTFSLWYPVGAHVALAYPDGRLRSTVDRAIVSAGYVATVGLAFLRHVVGPPLPPDCEPSCPRNVLSVMPNPELGAILDAAAFLSGTVLASAVFAVLALRLVRASPPERRVLAPAFWALTLAVTAYAGYVVAEELTPLPVAQAAYTVQIGAVVLIPIGLAAGLLRAAIARSSVGNLLIRIGEGRAVSELERDIAWALGDPSANLAFKRSGDARFTGISGDAIESGVTPRRTLTTVRESDDGVIAIVHDPSLRRDQPELLHAITAAARLALENQRLQAEVQLVRKMPTSLSDRLLREGAVIGHTRELVISVLMSDIRGYATIAETSDPRALAAQLNEHRQSMNGAISAEGGTIMQFVGDAVFAVFGAPLELGDHAPRAVRAAIKMQRAQEALNNRWLASAWPVFSLGIGVTTGPVAAALLGSVEHVEYSVVGDVVNLAQRIQGWAGPGQVVISDATNAELDGSIRTERLPVARVKGRQSPVHAYLIRPDPTAPLDQRLQHLGA
jgi:class 3 adenylate cyclase